MKTLPRPYESLKIGFMAPRTKPVCSIHRRQLAVLLKQFRTRSGQSLAQVGETLELNIGSLSRIENAERGVNPVLARALLDQYGVTDQAVRDRVLGLVRADLAQKRPWWKELSAVLSPAHYDGFLAFESSATVVRCYEPSVVPGLLQTEEYARALLREVSFDLPPDQIEDLVRVRLTRQRILTGAGGREPTRLLAVLDEAVLHRRVGGRAVMRAQLQRLVEVAGQGHVTVRVVPFTAGEHAGLCGIFNILEFLEPHSPVVWLENLTSSFFLEDPDDVQRYVAVFDRLLSTAADPAASVDLIRNVSREM
jgi:transcriptional regulator with XRE-family HTH domain